MIRAIIGLVMIYISIGGLYWLLADYEFRRDDNCSLHEYYTRKVLALPEVGEFFADQKGALYTVLILLDIVLIAAGPYCIVRIIITLIIEKFREIRRN